jgi:hypothetical protein
MERPPPHAPVEKLVTHCAAGLPSQLGDSVCGAAFDSTGTSAINRTPTRISVIFAELTN